MTHPNQSEIKISPSDPEPINIPEWIREDFGHLGEAAIRIAAEIYRDNSYIDGNPTTPTQRTRAVFQGMRKYQTDLS